MQETITLAYEKFMKNLANEIYELAVTRKAEKEELEARCGCR